MFLTILLIGEESSAMGREVCKFEGYNTTKSKVWCAKNDCPCPAEQREHCVEFRFSCCDSAAQKKGGR